MVLNMLVSPKWCQDFQHDTRFLRATGSAAGQNLEWAAKLANTAFLGRYSILRLSYSHAYSSFFILDKACPVQVFKPAGLSSFFEYQIYLLNKSECVPVRMRISSLSATSYISNQSGSI